MARTHDPYYLNPDAERFFDVGSSVDLDYLPQRFWDHEDLPQVAQEVERDVINWFTVTGRGAPREFFGPGHIHIQEDSKGAVFLWGYGGRPEETDGYDSDRSKWTDLAEALRYTIAQVIQHRLEHQDVDPTVTSERRGDRRVQREPDRLDPKWPRNWTRPLKRYDSRPTSYQL